MLVPILILSAALQGQASKSEAPKETPAPKAQDDALSTPEGAVRTFLAAMLIGDEATLRAVTLPIEPKGDFDWLLKSQSPPPDQVERIKAQVAGTPIRSLKPGDTFTLPGNRTITVQPDEVGDDRAVLVPAGAPIPTRCRKVDGRWRVDATPVVAGRKAADAARKKAEGRPKATPRPGR